MQNINFFNQINLKVSIKSITLCFLSVILILTCFFTISCGNPLEPVDSEEEERMTAPKAKALGFFSSFSVLNFGRWASFAYCDMLLGFYRVFVWLFQLIENSPSDLINLSNVEVAPASGAATGFLLSPN